MKCVFKCVPSGLLVTFIEGKMYTRTRPRHISQLTHARGNSSPDPKGAAVCSRHSIRETRLSAHGDLLFPVYLHMLKEESSRVKTHPYPTVGCGQVYKHVSEPRQILIMRMWLHSDVWMTHCWVKWKCDKGLGNMAIKLYLDCFQLKILKNCKAHQSVPFLTRWIQTMSTQLSSSLALTVFVLFVYQ